MKRAAAVSVLLLFLQAQGEMLPAQTSPVLSGDTVSITRIESYYQLRMTDPGWALITSREMWETLWRNYGSESRGRGDFFVVAPAPAVDFSVHEVLGFSYGSVNCNDFPVDVQHVIEQPAERVVVLYPEFPEDRVPPGVADLDSIPTDFGLVSVRTSCSAMYDRIDLILLPRSPKPLRFDLRARADIRLPPPAEWWRPVSIEAALDTGSSALQIQMRQRSLRVLPHDTTLSARDYGLLAAAAYARRDWMVQERLLGNPRAMASRAAVAWLVAAHALGSRRPSLRDFVERFGIEVASDNHAPLPWLEVLLEFLRSQESLGENGRPRFPDVAMALARNTVLHEDRALSERLIVTLFRYPKAKKVACQAFDARKYARRMVTGRNSRGMPTSGTLVPCEMKIPVPNSRPHGRSPRSSAGL